MELELDLMMIMSEDADLALNCTYVQPYIVGMCSWMHVQWCATSFFYEHYGLSI